MTVPACLVAAMLNGESTMTAPNAPTIGTATGGDSQASVTFTAPADDGGALITGYTVTSSPGGFTGTGSSSPIVVTGLSNGTAYTFTVTATNGVGTGSASAASNSVTPATAPGAPTIGTATAGIASASITFTPPSSDGGSAITGYTVTATATGTTTPVIATGTGAASPIVVSGLADSTTYDFTVHATNAAGNGPESGIATATTFTHYLCSFDAANKSVRVTLSGDAPYPETATGDDVNDNQLARATISATIGKHYVEFHCVTADTNKEAGLINGSQTYANYITQGGNGYSVAGLGTVQAGDIVGALLDGDAHTIALKINDVTVATYTSVPAVAWYPAVNCNGFGYPPTTQWLMRANNEVTYPQAGYDGFNYYS